MSEIHKIKPTTKLLRRFTALDLDRTVLDSTTFFEEAIVPGLVRYYASSSSEDTVRQVIKRTQREEKLRRGRAFDFLRYINDQMRSELVDGIDAESLAQIIIDVNRSARCNISQAFMRRIIAPGAFDLLATLESEPASEWAFLTSGGETTQRCKIRVVSAIIKQQLGFTVRAKVVATEHKAETIAREWYDDKMRTFRIPDEMCRTEHVYAERVRVIDDKHTNLAIPDDVQADAAESMQLFEVCAIGSSVRLSDTCVNLVEVMHSIKVPQQG